MKTGLIGAGAVGSYIVMGLYDKYGDDFMVIRMSKETGIACPYNEAVYDLIKALEEKNAGKFDYAQG